MRLAFFFFDMTGAGRTVTRLLAVVACLAAFSVSSLATDQARWRHAISLTGNPKYGPEFRRPDYVNPLAPKGGSVRLGIMGTYDNFNPFIDGVKGNLAAYLMMIYEPLFWITLDEPTTEYGLMAEAVSYPDDFSSASFRLRPEARWHDGRPVTADDVVFSFAAWKRLSPQLNRSFSRVSGVEKISAQEVRFSFSEKGDPALPLYVGQMSILPKHWWEGVDGNGQKRDIEATTLEIPLGSGPYRLKSFDAGRSLTYERVPDYWGREIPIRVGTGNFGTLKIEYFRDANVMFEAFKADSIDIRRESSLKSWVVGYDFPAVQDGQIRKEVFGIERLGLIRALVFNLRQPKFQDLRVRKALALAFNFDDINRTVFHNMLATPASYFPHTDFMADGALSPEEVKLLASLPGDHDRAALAAATDATVEKTVRGRLFEALQLLREAGYTLQGTRLLDRQGDQLTIEFLMYEPTMQRVATAYASQLEKLGIAVVLRAVDEVQYQNRLRAFDFDIAPHGWVQGHAPGNEQREYWTSASADLRGSNNLGGLSNPFVDQLVEAFVLAPSRPEKVAAGRLLDRTLRMMHIAIPVLVEDKELVAHWDRFGHPAKMPRYGATAFPMIWWWDEAKARKVGRTSR